MAIPPCRRLETFIALLAMACVVLPGQQFLPSIAFQVPRAQSLAASPKPVSESQDEAWSQSKSLDRFVGAVELCLGLGLVAISSGAIRLHSLPGRSSLRAMPSKAWLAPGTQSDLAGMYGVTEPCGSKGVYYWDPANLAENMNASKLRAFRNAEIKHGRVCMLASLGWLVQEKFRIPWLNADKAPNGFKALQYYLNLPRETEGESGTATAASAVLITIVFACGYIERNASDEGRDPGDFGDPANWYALNREFNKGGGGFNSDLEFFRDCEINHCRLAMIGMLAAASAEYSSGFSEVSLQWAGTNAFALEFFKSLPFRVLPSSMY